MRGKLETPKLGNETGLCFPRLSRANSQRVIAFALLLSVTAFVAFLILNQPASCADKASSFIRGLQDDALARSSYFAQSSQNWHTVDNCSSPSSLYFGSRRIRNYWSSNFLYLLPDYFQGAALSFTAPVLREPALCSCAFRIRKYSGGRGDERLMVERGFEKQSDTAYYVKRGILLPDGHYDEYPGLEMTVRWRP